VFFSEVEFKNDRFDPRFDMQDLDGLFQRLADENALEEARGHFQRARSSAHYEHLLALLKQAKGTQHDFSRALFSMPATTSLKAIRLAFFAEIVSNLHHAGEVGALHDFLLNASAKIPQPSLSPSAATDLPTNSLQLIQVLNKQLDARSVQGPTRMWLVNLIGSLANFEQDKEGLAAEFGGDVTKSVLLRSPEIEDTFTVRLPVNDNRLGDGVDEGEGQEQEEEGQEEEEQEQEEQEQEEPDMEEDDYRRD
jgi:hypothetical protein